MDIRPFFAMPKPDEEGNMPEESPPVCYVQDILHDRELFAWAGLTIEKQEAYLLQKSLKTLASTSSAS
jgi:hypothetical protein